VDAVTLDSFLDAIVETSFQGVEPDTLISETIHGRMEELRVLTSTVPESAPPWREELLTMAHKLVHPHDIDWMDDDDNQRYVQHALDDIVSIYKS
jgi:hypothetical protein